MRRVVVTGIGMCAPLGYGADYCWRRLINSESGINKLTCSQTARDFGGNSLVNLGHWFICTNWSTSGRTRRL